MANEEGIKIPIIAEDRFTETIKKIDAYTKLFGETASNTERKLAAMEKEMVRLVVNGMDPANKKIVEMRSNYDKLNQSLNNGTGSLKDANKKWTSLSLVVQDLPYGFRGIQNNLPALFGSLASGAGAAYFAFSAVVAVITAMDMGLFKTKKTADLLTEANKEYADSLKESAGAAGEEISKINALVAVASNHELVMSKRLAAVKELQSEYPAYFGNLSQEQILNGEVSKSVNGVKTAILERAKATAVASKINKLSAEKFVQDERLYQLALQKTYKIQQAIAYVNKMKAAGFDESSKHLQGLIDAQIGGIRQEEATIKATVTAIDKELARLDVIYANTTANTVDLSKGNTPDDIKKPKVSKYNEQLAQEQFNFYKDSITRAEYYYSKLNEIQKLNALEEARINGASKTELETIEKIYAQKLLNFQQQIEDKKFSIREATTKRQEDLTKQSNKNLKDEQEKTAKAEVDVIKSALNVKLRLNKDNLIGQQNAVKDSLDKLSVDMAAAVGTAGFPILLKYYDELNAKLEAMDTSALRGAEAMKKVNGIISDMASNSIIQLADNIGKALGGENVDLFGGFIELLSSGLQDIGKALIVYGAAMDAFKKAFKNPYAAIAAGIALVAAGAMLKSKINKTSGGAGGGQTRNIPAFANGGIISGPTMGLMGEYPGARSNPEVVAPLDKLKDMLGGGQGGTFLLRGQDLLLSVNRAQKASNLKGQTISLA
jgi:hypothetical protein